MINQDVDWKKITSGKSDTKTIIELLEKDVEANEGSTYDVRLRMILLYLAKTVKDLEDKE